MIHMIVDFCKHEHVPKESSLTYQRNLVLYGPLIADQQTYEVIYPPWEEDDAQMAAGSAPSGFGADPRIC